MKTTYTHSEAETLAYIAIGCNTAFAEDREGLGAHWAEGHMGMVSACIDAAVLCEQAWEEYENKDSFGAVFLYEVAEPLGAWLYGAGDTVTPEEIKAQAVVLIGEASSVEGI